jgi:hypothetical protein
MIQHVNKARITNFNKVISSKDGDSVEIKKIFKLKNGVETQVYPNPASNLRIESNYDNAITMKIDPTISELFPVPVINGEEENIEPLRITVTPYPANAGWFVHSSNNFDSSQYEGQIFYGTQTLEFPVPVPGKGGYESYYVYFESEHNSCEKQTFAFFGIKYEVSDLSPSAWWSFDDGSLVDQISGLTLQQTQKTDATINEANEFTSGVGNGLGLRAVESQNGDSNIYEVPYAPAWYNDKRGVSISLSGKFKRHGTVGFVDPTTNNFTEGHHFFISWDYSQPKCALPLGAAQTKPETTTQHRVDYTWHHLALTLTEVLDLKNDSRFKVDYSSNSYGTITYQSPYVAYSDTMTNTQYVNYFTGFKVRLARFYIDGILQGEALVKASLNHKGVDQSAIPLGRGTFMIKFLNNAEASSSWPDVIDEVKLFNGVLSESDIRKECSILGFTFDDSTSTDTSKKPAMIEKNGRARLDQGGIANIVFKPRMKVFIIDSKTIAVACNFREFMLSQLYKEFPNLGAIETNYRNGYTKDWQRTFYYSLNMWDLYRDYIPVIIDRIDDVNNWRIDDTKPVMLGRWQNSTGLLKIDDALDQTDFIKPDIADLNHFAYFTMPNQMAEGSKHKVNWCGTVFEFEYSKDKYCSSIKVNQEGYSTEAGRKYAYFGMWLGLGGAHTSEFVSEGTSFHIVDSTTYETVYTGTLQLRDTVDIHRKKQTSTEYIHYPLTGEITYVMDFSDFNDEGKYKIYIPGVGYSHEFEVGNDAMGRAFYIHCRGLFHHRSGCSQVRKPYTNWEYLGCAQEFTYESKFICNENEYADCKTADGTTYSSIFTHKHFDMIPNNVTGRIFRDVKGGWFDAADFDRRTYHFQCVRDLCEAYIRFPENFTDNQLNLPESGNSIPDILSEAEWGLNVWMRAQTEEGGIAAWIETFEHEADWPWRSTHKYYIGMPNRRDSLEYAQSAAKFVRALQMVGTPIAMKKAAMYMESAIRAWNFGVNPENRATHTFTQTDANNNVYEFTYSESDAIADVWLIRAATALFMVTKESRFAEYINETTYNYHVVDYKYDENRWATKLCTELAVGDLKEYFPTLVESEQQYMLQKTDQWYGYQELQTYHEANWPPDHGYFLNSGWGLMHPETRGRAFIWSWIVTGDTKYRDAAYLLMDNAMGCNCMGRTLTTGLGKVAPVQFLNSWLPRAELEWGFYEPEPGISPYTFVGQASGAVPYGFRLSKDARADFNFALVGQVILPGGYRHTVENSRGGVAVWLQTRWPLWRNLFECQNNFVEQSEFTVWETISGKAFMAGCLLKPGFEPTQELKDRAPSTDRWSVEGFIYLP